MFALTHEPMMGWQFFGSTIPKRRYRFALCLIFFVSAAMLFRAFYLQVIQGENYLAQAAGNQYRVHTHNPPRGVLFDRRKTVLAANTPTFHLLLTVKDLPQGEEEQKTLLEELRVWIGTSSEEWDALINEAREEPLEPHLIASGLPYEEALRLLTRISSLPGITIETTTKRTYPVVLESLGHLLGYTGVVNKDEFAHLRSEGYRRVDEIGKSGLEKTLEKTLRGTPGHTSVEVDATGKERGVVTKEDAVPGENVVLSIDVEFQAFIEQRLKTLFAKTKTSRASVVVMNPHNGEILALVSLPGFDPNLFSGRVDPTYYQALLENKHQPLFHRAVSGMFPSGSTFKPFVSYAALAEGLITEKTQVLSTGGLRVGEWFFPDWKAGGHGLVDVKTAIAWSVNTFYYTIGGGFGDQRGLGAELITQYANWFGFGKPTGVELPNEAPGFLPTSEWKWRVKQEEWYIGDSYHYAIGQGDLLVTPLQMAHATAIIAADGVVHRPTLLVQNTPPIGTPIPELNLDTLQIVQQGMRDTVTRSARQLSALSVSSAGKTGTAQAPGGQENHAWYMGYAPFENPEIAFAVLIEEGKGGTVAVPLAKELIHWWFTYGTTNR